MHRIYMGLIDIIYNLLVYKPHNTTDIGICIIGYYHKRYYYYYCPFTTTTTTLRLLLSLLLYYYQHQLLLLLLLYNTHVDAGSVVATAALESRPVPVRGRAESPIASESNRGPSDCHLYVVYSSYSSSVSNRNTAKIMCLIKKITTLYLYTIHSYKHTYIHTVHTYSTHISILMV